MSQPTTEGVAVAVRQLAAGAAGLGWDVTVACPAEGDLAGWVTADGVGWLRLELTRSPGPADAEHVAHLRVLLRRFDVTHLHSSKAGAVGRLALASLGGDRRPGCVFTPHGWSWQVGGTLATAYRVFETAVAPLADAIVAVSHAEEAEGRSVLGRRGAVRLRTITNGADTRRFRPDGPVAPRSEAPLVVCVARFAPEKGQDVAIDALAALTDRTARLRLVGDGLWRPALEAQAEALGVADRVEWTGTIPDVAPHLRAADVVVVPSRREGMSLVLLEAMACGSCLVATAVNGTEALGNAGVVVRPGDPLALAAAIDGLLADPDRRARLGAAARAVAVDRYDQQRTVRRNVGLWEALTRRGPSPRR